MKKVCIIILVLGLIGCGTYEDDLVLNSLHNDLLLLKKADKSRKISTTSVANMLKKIEISVSEDPAKLFSEDVPPEFSINSVIDLVIAARFSYFSGYHKIGMKIFLPDGSLYFSSDADVDFDKNASYSENGIIIENSDMVLTAKYIMPVAGTELAIFMLTGKYKAEIYLDGNMVAEKEFVLK